MPSEIVEMSDNLKKEKKELVRFYDNLPKVATDAKCGRDSQTCRCLI